MVISKVNKQQQQVKENVVATTPTTSSSTAPTVEQTQHVDNDKSNNVGNTKKPTNMDNNSNNDNNENNNKNKNKMSAAVKSNQKNINNRSNNNNLNSNNNNNNNNKKATKSAKQQKQQNLLQHSTQRIGNSNNNNNNNNNNKTQQTKQNLNKNKKSNSTAENSSNNVAKDKIAKSSNNNNKNNNNNNININNKNKNNESSTISSNSKTPLLKALNPGDILTAALTSTCAKCSKTNNVANTIGNDATNTTINSIDALTTYTMVEPVMFTNKQYRKSKSYVGTTRHNSIASISSTASADPKNSTIGNGNNNNNNNNNKSRQYYRRSYSDRRSSFDRNFAERNKDFVPIVPPAKPVLSSSNIAAVIADTEKFVIIERLTKGRITYPIMQCGTLDAPDSSYHQQRSNRMDAYQIDDGFHSDGGTETPPPSPSSGSSIASTSDHGSLESVDTGGTQRLAVLSFDQVRKLHHVMDEKVAIHGRGNFPTLEVTLKDLVNLVRRKLEADVGSGGAGVTVKDIRLNGGAASHVLASEDQPYNDLDLIYAIELSSSRHFDRVKTAVLNTLLDLLPEGVSKRRIMPCALKEAYVGKMVKVNNNNDGDRWSLISLGNSPGHKNVELKFVDTMRRQFEFSVDSFQIVLDSLLLFYDCATLPISENFYPTVVGESVYGDFQEALYHLQKKLISTRQPEEIRGGGLLKYCNLLVRNYEPVDPPRIKTLERYMCSRFFIDFPDINTQTVKLEAYLRNHFWGIEEEPLQYEYLMHLREVVANSTVCLMGHERRQTLQLIESLAGQVLYKEQQKQHPHLQEQHYQLHTQAQQQNIDMQTQPQQQTVTLVTTTTTSGNVTQHQQHHQQHQQQQTTTLQPQTIYVHQTPQAGGATTTTATICCAMPATTATVIEQQQQQQQQHHHHQQHHHQQQQQSQTVTTTTTTVPQTIQIQAGPPGLIYANGVYYAPVIPTTICTCNSAWLST